MNRPSPQPSAQPTPQPTPQPQQQPPPQPVTTARFPRQRASSHAVQGTLALDLRGGRPGLPETPELEPPGPARLPHVSDAEVRAWAARLAQAVVEAVGLQRPVSQLVRWTSPNVYRDLERRVLLVRRAADGVRSVRPQVRSIHVCRPTPSCAEVSVHLRHGGRSRALAMRMERRGERWQCTVLEFG